MEQYGKVIKRLDDKKVLVMVRRHSACKNCGGCGGAMKAGAPGESFVEALDPLGAAKGADVRLETETRNVLLSAFLLYLVPLVGLLLGVIAGRGWAISAGMPGDADLWGLGLGIIVMITVLFFLRKQEKLIKRSGRFEIIITDILKSG